MEYSVDTDKEFFEKFEEMQLKLRNLGALFQNKGIELSGCQVAEWDSACSNFLVEVDNLLAEAGSRIERK